jgi:hypothetical protein
MKLLYDYIFKNETLPRWIVLLNYGSLLGVDCYPLFLLVLTYLSFKIFRVSKPISAVLPLGPLIGYVYIIFEYLIPGIGQVQGIPARPVQRFI